MPNIRPSSEIRNNYNEISEFCHKFNEPVYITKNGHGDLAVLSIEAYEKLVGKFELYKLLDIGLSDIESSKTKSAKEVFSNLKASIKNEDI